MAATCIMSIHINKGKTARQCIGERLDYIMNPKKTDGGILVSTYACSPETAADEFMLFRQEYQQSTGRTQDNEVIGYHVRQAFKPDEITPEEAKPGDLVFFEKTISGVDGITHCGIYVGDGFMLHCGSPIGYADLRDSYWQQHFFGYGRLAKD